MQFISVLFLVLVVDVQQYCCCYICQKPRGTSLKDEFCPRNSEAILKVNVFEGTIMDKIESVRNDKIMEDTSDMTIVTYNMKVTEVYKGPGDINKGDLIQLTSDIRPDSCGHLKLSVDKVYLLTASGNLTVGECYIVKESLLKTPDDINWLSGKHQCP